MELLHLILSEHPAILEEGKALVDTRIRREILARLPEAPGVYFFHDDSGKVIYVGKSNDIRKRVVSHFANDKTVKGAAMKDRIADVSWELTGSETLALLRESAEIKRMMPVFNKQGRRKGTTYGLFHASDEQGYLHLSILALGKRKCPVHTFSTKAEARAFMVRLWEEFDLCQKLCGMYKSSESCFYHTIGKCHGACVGREHPESYNARVNAALDRYRFQVNDFALVDLGRHEDERSVMVVQGGEYKGYGYFSQEFIATHREELPSLVAPQDHDRDARMILRQAFRNGNYLDLITLGTSRD